MAVGRLAVKGALPENPARRHSPPPARVTSDPAARRRASPHHLRWRA